MNFNRPLILASKSPRRQELLNSLGFSFDVQSKDTDESFSDTIPPLEVAKYLAEKKAKAFDNELEDKVVITADTIVLLGTEIIGKPKDELEAYEMLSKLSGNCHKVITGVCIKSLGITKVFDDVTEVRFKSLKDDEIDYYIKNYKPFDKAGAYGIQEWMGMIGITEMKGSYFNVMGLPVHKLYAELIKF